MDILNLIESLTHTPFKKKASTRGGEYSGSCPWCGGRDRFSIHPRDNHFVCRQCKKAGDAISFIINHEHIPFKKAQAMAAKMGFPVDLEYKATGRYDNTKAAITPWEPREDTQPPAGWQTKAQAYLFQCYKFLLSSNSEAQAHRRWLNARGLSNNLIKTARMGWNLRSVTFSREAWGLSPEKNNDGKNKQIWIPEGLVIPYFKNGQLIRLRIRQSNPITDDRFIMVPGSSMDYFDYRAADPGATVQQLNPDSENTVLKKPPAGVVEAELDGWVLHDQACFAGVDLHVFGIGNSSTRPNQGAYDILSQSPRIHCCLDNDGAGDMETRWWRNKFIRAVDSRIPSSAGKDPGEAFESGFDFTGWLQSLIANPKNNSNSKESQDTQAPQDLQDEDVECFFDSVSDPDDEIVKPFNNIVKSKIEIEKKIECEKDQNLFDVYDMGKICIHGRHCDSIKKGQCLRVKKNVFSLERCPADHWYRVNDGPISKIILGFNFKARTHS